MTKDPNVQHKTESYLRRPKLAGEYMMLDRAKCVPGPLVVRSLSVVLRTLHRRASNVNKDATPGIHSA